MAMCFGIFQALILAPQRLHVSQTPFEAGAMSARVRKKAELKTHPIIVIIVRFRRD